ncbi:MAG: hypothetical protein CL535_21115 [Ahrensia sp.]|nr:hypothetical protein [Ahrensia sp.]|tara:strand:+ start:11488 stop:12258 length:771 start_codon:yes stop_codon:yes gene_type:complete
MTDRPAFRSWRSYWNFSREVSRRRRYIWSEETKVFLDTVAATVDKRIRELPPSKVFWRAQLGHGWRFEDQIDDDIPAAFEPKRMRPLADRAYEGRVNPKGIPCLYIATTKDSAMSEVRPGVGSLISVAQFKTTRALRLVDCSVHHASQKFYLEEPDADEREEAVWAQIDHAFADPVTRSDDTAGYAPTQLLAELFADLGYDGVVYKSAFGDDGFNIALFDLDAAEQLNCFLYRARKAVFEFTQEDNPYFIRKKSED